MGGGGGGEGCETELQRCRGSKDGTASLGWAALGRAGRIGVEDPEVRTPRGPEAPNEVRRRGKPEGRVLSGGGGGVPAGVPKSQESEPTPPCTAARAARAASRIGNIFDERR